MRKKTEISEILKANPHISPESLEEARKALHRLRARGVGGRGYRLVPPFAGRRVSNRGDADKDPRTVELRSLSDRA